MRRCLDIVLDVNLEAQFYSSCIERGQVNFEEWNWNSKLQRWLSQKRPISVMFFVWTLYLMLTATTLGVPQLRLLYFEESLQNLLR